MSDTDAKPLDPALFEALWAEIEPIVFITREQFRSGLEGWTVAPHHVDGRLAYVTLTQGPELHYSKIDPDAPPVTLSLIRAWMAPLLARYGYVTTRTPKEDRRQQRLNLRIGGRITHEDEFFVHFRLDT